MKIIILKWDGYGYPDMCEALEEFGHELVMSDFPKNTPQQNPEYEVQLTKLVEDTKPDFIFSFNYFPLAAIVAKNTDTKYVAWVYDNPLVLIYSYTIIYPTNYVFLFDKTEYNKFKLNNINTVYYLPLCANAKRIGGYDDIPYFKTTKWYNQGDIAFVGSLYSEEKHNFFNRMFRISPYTRGYLEGLIDAQKKVYGVDVVEKSLTDAIMDDMEQDLPMGPDNGTVETREFIYGQYVINRYITSLERKEAFTRIGEKYKFDLYTYEKDFTLPNCINHGPIESYEGSPYIYKTAKINMNISLRSITTGIPLRCFEIMGSGGFLLSNYQADFDDCYTAFEDYAYYEDLDDMMDKIDYYLTHEKERKEIAENGYRKTLENYTYEHRIKQILEVVFPE